MTCTQNVVDITSKRLLIAKRHNRLFKQNGTHVAGLSGRTFARTNFKRNRAATYFLLLSRSRKHLRNVGHFELMGDFCKVYRGCYKRNTWTTNRSIRSSRSLAPESKNPDKLAWMTGRRGIEKVKENVSRMGSFVGEGSVLDHPRQFLQRQGGWQKKKSQAPLLRTYLTCFEKKLSWRWSRQWSMSSKWSLWKRGISTDAILLSISFPDLGSRDRDARELRVWERVWWRCSDQSKERRS